MRRTLGIDVGSTTVKAVVIAQDGRVLHRACERHRGRPRELARRLAAAAREAFAPERTGITGSIGVALAGELEASPVHEVRAVVRAVRALHPSARTIVELGGQDAKLVFLGERAAEDDAQMNDRCAAGTGATIDRVARRLALGERELAGARLAGSLSVAARCGVFAETDLVNLVKRGAPRAEAISALARAIVAQNLSLLARGRAVRPPVLLLGGPHAHLPLLAEAWREQLAELWAARGIDPGEVVVPGDAELYAALGAARAAEASAAPAPRLGKILGGARVRGPLLDQPIDLDPLRCAPPPRIPAGPLEAHVGLDAGSTTSKAVLLDAQGALLGAVYRPSAGDPVDDARECLAALRAEARASGAELCIRSLGVTGYGAPLVAAALGADAAPVETLAHAAAVRAALPDADVVVDVGGTDAKILLLEGARVRGFHVSNQCSAGHGAFAAACAAELGVPIEEVSPRALSARRVPLFTVGCSVFVDTDRVTFQRDGFDVDEILAGLALSLVRNVWEYVVPEPPARLGQRFVLTGGVHKSLAVAVAQARYLASRVPGARVHVHPHPELCGAIGAALEAARAIEGPSRFVGLDAMREVRVSVRTGRETRCTRCELECARSLPLRGGARRAHRARRRQRVRAGRRRALEREAHARPRAGSLRRGGRAPLPAARADLRPTARGRDLRHPPGDVALSLRAVVPALPAGRRRAGRADRALSSDERGPLRRGLGPRGARSLLPLEARPRACRAPPRARAADRRPAHAGADPRAHRRARDERHRLVPPSWPPTPTSRSPRCAARATSSPSAASRR
ncbi:MAG: hypothetical protein M5U28_16845 [Sandaracinaceae bacterium]|nr:hypothetical protein [Sandaracinaceae bacterium]